MIGINWIKYGAIGLALLGLFAWGYYLGKGQTEVRTEVQDRIVYKEGETHTVYVDRIVTVTKTVKPDGTVTEVTKTEDKNTTKETKNEQVAKETSKETTVKSTQSQYSLGVGYRPTFDREHLYDYSRFEATAGYRVIGPAWIELGLRPATRDFTIGVRVEL